MKKLLISLGLLFGMSLGAHASIRSNFIILESLDSIRFHVNDLAKNYLLYVQFGNTKAFLPAIQNDLKIMAENFQEITLANNDKKTKEIMTFFSYQRAQIMEIVHKKPDQESAKKILEISESFLEGAAEVSHQHPYRFEREEKMFMLTRASAADLESLLKYYLARTLNSDNNDTLKKIARARERFVKDMAEIQAYDYRDESVLRTRVKLSTTWDAVDFLLKKSEPKADLPILLTSGAVYMHDMLHELSIYHSKNQ